MSLLVANHFWQTCRFDNKDRIAFPGQAVLFKENILNSLW